MNNSYYDIAYNDYLFVRNNIGNGFYNNTLPILQQVCEKLLKSVIIDFDLVTDQTERIMKTHRIDRLYEAIEENLPIPLPFELNTESLAWLTNFYFDCRYPGDSFIIATQKHEEKAFKLAERVLEFTNLLRQQLNSKQIFL